MDHVIRHKSGLWKVLIPRVTVIMRVGTTNFTSIATLDLTDLTGDDIIEVPGLPSLELEPIEREP